MHSLSLTNKASCKDESHQFLRILSYQDRVAVPDSIVLSPMPSGTPLLSTFERLEDELQPSMTALRPVLDEVGEPVMAIGELGTGSASSQRQWL